MKLRNSIRRPLALLLLLVFALAITPKLQLHDALASHKEGGHHAKTGETVIGSAHIHCDCDDLVADSPFTGPAACFEPAPPAIHEELPEAVCPAAPARGLALLENRGPPGA